MSRLLAVILALQTWALVAAENRIEFRTMRGEEHVEGSEVCFFPAAQDDGFFQKFLTTNDVRCLSADAVLSLPRGFFNVFARNGSTLVSTHPTFIDNENPSEGGYRQTEITLFDAATLDVSAATRAIGTAEWLAIYFSNESEPQSPVSVRPVARGENSVLVPAGMTLVPLVVRSGVVVRVGQPIALLAGETKPLVLPAQWGSGHDVVALLRTDVLAATDIAPPDVILDGTGPKPTRPMLPIRPAGLFERSLAIFKDVPPGTHDIRLSGEGWQPDSVSVSTTPATAVVTAARPLVARRAALVEVTASIGTLAEVATNVRCPGAESSEPENEQPETAGVAATLRLLGCASTSDRCESVRELPLPVGQRDYTVRWTDLQPGSYVAELTLLGFTERSESRDVAAAHEETFRIALHPETITGRVTHGREPVQAIVSFDHSLAPTLSDESGNYVAVVGKGPRKSLVQVRLCNGAVYEYLPAAPVDQTLDIDVPKNRLVIRVVDENHRPLAGAAVHGGPQFPEHDATYTFLSFPPTDERGETSIENVVTGDALDLCATHPPDYDQGCATSFQMGDEPVRRAEIILRSRSTFSGKLVTTTPITGGVVWVVSPEGVVLDAGFVSEAGEFTVKRPAVPGAYLIHISRSHPLTVFPLPAAGIEETFRAPLPAQGRPVAVTLESRSRKRRVALEIDGRVIPTQILGMHLALRRLQETVEPGATILLPDLSGANLAIYSIPYVTDYPPEWNGLEPFEHPHLRIALPRFPVNGATVTIE